MFGRDFLRKKHSTLLAECKKLPSQARPEIAWSLRVLEQAGEERIRAAMPPKPKAPKKAAPEKAPAKKATKTKPKTKKASK